MLPAVLSVTLVLVGRDGRSVDIPMSTVFHARGPWVVRAVKLSADFDSNVCTVDIPADIPVVPSVVRRVICPECGGAGRASDVSCVHCGRG